MKLLSRLLLGLGIVSSSISLTHAEVLTVSAPWELKAEKPAVGGYAFSRLGITESLIAIDKKGLLKPQLATRWSVSNDKKTWTITLREGVKFHDGELLSANNVVDALTLAKTQPGPLKKVPIQSITAKNNQVIITLTKPYSILPSVLSHFTTMILSPKVYSKKGAVDRIIGTGPFKMVSFQPPQRMDIVKNEAYWGDKANLEKIEYLAISRGETRALMAESKKAAMIHSLNPASIARLKKNPNLVVSSIMLPRVIIIKLNNQHAFLKDLNVRQALSQAIDRYGIAAALMRAPEIKTTQLFPPSLAAWHKERLPSFSYNVANAKQLLKSAGWVINSDGYAEKAGKVFEITMRTYPDRPELPLIANALQDQFKAIGIKLNISIGNYTEIPAGHQDGTLEMGLISRNYSQIQSPLGSISSDFGPGGADWGAMNWTNDSVAKALEALKLDNADANADTHRQTVIEAIHHELPVIPVTWYKKSVVTTKNLENVSLDPFDSSYRLNEIKIKSD